MWPDSCLEPHVERHVIVEARRLAELWVLAQQNDSTTFNLKLKDNSKQGRGEKQNDRTRSRKKGEEVDDIQRNKQIKKDIVKIKMIWVAKPETTVAI